MNINESKLYTDTKVIISRFAAGELSILTHDILIYNILLL